MLASYAQCDKLMVIVYFTISIVFQGVPGTSINPLDLSPNYAGILMGIGTTVGGMTGILAPYVVGVFTPHVSHMKRICTYENCVTKFLFFAFSPCSPSGV